MKEFIAKLGKILDEVERERGPIEFAALVEREETPTKYDLLVSASWIIDEYEFYEYFAPKLVRLFGDSDWSRYSRTVVLDPKGDFVGEFIRVVGPIGANRDVINIRVANINVLYAHLFPTHLGHSAFAHKAA